MNRVRLTQAIKISTPLTGDVGQTLYVSAIDAANLVAYGFAVHLDGGGPSTPGTSGHEGAGTLTHVGEEASQSGDSPERRAEDGVEEPPKRPKPYSPKDMWIEYAVSVDEKMTEERAEGMTKADLISRYGERL